MIRLPGATGFSVDKLAANPEVWFGADSQDSAKDNNAASVKLNISSAQIPAKSVVTVPSWTTASLSFLFDDYQNSTWDRTTGEAIVVDNNSRLTVIQLSSCLFSFLLAVPGTLRRIYCASHWLLLLDGQCTHGR